MLARVLASLALLSASSAAPAWAGPPPALDQVRALETGETFLVTPRWSPEGALLASGRGGRGLFRLPLGGGALEVLDPAAPVPDGRLAAPDEEGRTWLPAGAGVLVFEEYTGRLTAFQPWGVRPLAEGAWDVRPSPDGRRVAFCLGHLIAPTLVVVDLAGPASWRLPGAHPAWAPDGSGLVFTRPAGAPELGGDAPFSSAALVWWSAEDGAEVELWTSGLPFQPALSPDGAMLAWSDWATGRLHVGRLRRQGVRP